MIAPDGINIKEWAQVIIRYPIRPGETNPIRMGLKRKEKEHGQHAARWDSHRAPPKQQVYNQLQFLSSGPCGRLSHNCCQSFCYHYRHYFFHWIPPKPLHKAWKPRWKHERQKEREWERAVKYLIYMNHWATGFAVTRYIWYDNGLLLNTGFQPIMSSDMTSLTKAT